MNSPRALSAFLGPLLLLIAAHAQAAPPNIVLIMADDVGCETLGCYGGESYKTPRLDQLAKEGMKFRYCFSMPVCHPTRVCLLSGRYPFRLKNPKWGTYPPKAESETFAHRLRKAGYATAISGKWQLTMMNKDPNHPKRLGFQESCLFGWHEGPRYYRPMVYQNGKHRPELAAKYGPDVYCDFLIDFMKRHRKGPFLAYYSMAFCHDVTDDLKEPVPVGPRGRYDNYREMLEGMDARVGRVLDAIDRLGLRENTIVLFTTDNGTPSRYIAGVKDGKLVRKSFTSQRRGKAAVGGKGKLTDAGTNVPLIARWPGKTKSAQTSDALIDFSDFYATLSEMAGLAAKKGIDSRSFVPALLGGAGKRSWAYSQTSRNAWVRTQRFKLYRNGRIFDVRSDPLEKSPLSMDDLNTQQQAVVENLSKAWLGLKNRKD